MINPKIASEAILAATSVIPEGIKSYLSNKRKTKEAELELEIKNNKLKKEERTDKRKNTTGIIAAALLSSIGLYAIKKFNDNTE